MPYGAKKNSGFFDGSAISKKADQEDECTKSYKNVSELLNDGCRSVFLHYNYEMIKSLPKVSNQWHIIFPMMSYLDCSMICKFKQGNNGRVVGCKPYSESK